MGPTVQLRGLELELQTHADGVEPVRRGAKDKAIAHVGKLVMIVEH